MKGLISMSHAATKVSKAIFASLAALTLVFAITACAANDKIDMAKVTSVIDVRTADEFAAGHLEGAFNYDVESSGFVAQVSALDTSGTYVLYCHSGRRAGIALDAMKTMGFKNLTNAGGIDAASAATGLAIVQ